MSDVFGTVVGMGFHGTLGAMATTDFGKKGVAAGAVFGAGSFLAGGMLQDDEDPTFSGAIASGFISGSMQSAFSSAQEIYAFHNPAHISNVSSINTTTSATTFANAMYTAFSKEGRDQYKELRKTDSEWSDETGKKKGRFESAYKMFETNMLTPENVLSDVTRMNMIYNDNEAGSGKLLRMMGLDKDAGGFNPFSAAKGHYDDIWEAARVADEGGVWFGQGKQDFEIESKDFFGQKIDADGDALVGRYFDKDGEEHIMPQDHNGRMETFGVGRERWFEENNIDQSKTIYYKQNPAYGQRGVEDRFLRDTDNNAIESTPHKMRVTLGGTETIDERMAKYMDANKLSYERVIKQMAVRDAESGKTPVFREYDDFRSYLTSMDGGALGTYRELEKAGFYDDKTPRLKKMMAYTTETMYGSPAWGRIVDKQLKNNTVELEDFVDDDGNKKVRFKGGGKFGRAVGLVADIAAGGALNAGMNAGIFLAGAPYRALSEKNPHTIDANNPINPISHIPQG